MSRLHEAWNKIPLKGDLQVISADEVRKLSGREPRLMMKFDHSVNLPPGLAGRFILPLKNGLYAIIKGEGYHQPEWCGEVEEFCRKTRFELKTTSTGISEMQHLDIAFNTGLLAHFLGEPVLYPTIRGRKRSPYFSFRVGEHQLEAEGVQVEIDGGFEGRRSVTLVEAKIGECDDFHLRQLYYPVRFWSTHTRKTIRSVFFTYEPVEEVYRFREYCFDPVEVYQRPHLLKAKAYRIVEAPSASFQPVTRESKFPFPQADRLDKVALIPFLVSEGHRTPQQIGEMLEFTERQGRYYLDACKALGLVDQQGRLTPEGSDYLTCTPELRYRLLCRSVFKLQVMKEILINLLLSPTRSLRKEEVEQVVRQVTSLAPATATRRTRTVWSWLTWVSHYSPALTVDSERVTVAEEVTASPADEVPSQQLSLF